MFNEKEEQLKTLKDIYFGFDIAEIFMKKNISGADAGVICAEIQLIQRQEAIKWMKHDTKLEDYIVDDESDPYYDDGVESIKKFIKHVFNISEEELK